MPNQMPPKGSPFVLPKALVDIHAHQQPRLPGHICTGPVAVRDAKRGQVLEVRIRSIELNYDWGYNMIRPRQAPCRTTSKNFESSISRSIASA